MQKLVFRLSISLGFPTQLLSIEKKCHVKTEYSGLSLIVPSVGIILAGEVPLVADTINRELKAGNIAPVSSPLDGT